MSNKVKTYNEELQRRGWQPEDEKIKTYRVKEIFSTLQGEGVHAGRRATFVRFAGCNLWTGQGDHRLKSYETGGAHCALWCDTDFIDGTKMDAGEICDAIRECGLSDEMVVFTGGEPLLQLDFELLSFLRSTLSGAEDRVFAVETNGTVAFKQHADSLLDHICVSPKMPADQLKLRHGTELKIVWPDYDPADFEEYGRRFQHKFVSACADTMGVGESRIVPERLSGAAAWVMGHPGWRLTIQTHKLAGIR